MRRERLIVAAALALACALAWLWLLRQGALMTPAPRMDVMKADAMGQPPASLAYWIAAFVMWSLMMVAMMLPSAAPMIIFYARMAGGARPGGSALPQTLAFAGVYVAVWTAFSALAAFAQARLAALGLISASHLALGDGRLAGILLLAAAAYQLTPLKRACLAQCRSPIGLVMQHWRPGWRGALRLGARHALFCVGCCWALMGLLFVGGVMSLPWVAFLALVVLAEKVAPIGERSAWAIGAVAAAAGVALMAGAPLLLP